MTNQFNKHATLANQTPSQFIFDQSLDFIDMRTSVLLLVALFALFAFSVAETADELKQKAIDFHAEKAKEEGVVTLESGLQYKVLEKGTGTAHPVAS